MNDNVTCANPEPSPFAGKTPADILNHLNMAMHQIYAVPSPHADVLHVSKRRTFREVRLFKGRRYVVKVSAWDLLRRGAVMVHDQGMVRHDAMPVRLVP